MSEKEEGEDSEELWLKAKKDAKDKAYNAFMGAASRHRRRCRAFQVGSDLSTTATSDSNSNLEESDSSDDFNSRDNEGEEEEDEKEEDEEEEDEEDMAPDYP